MTALIQGFALCLALKAALGPQNAFLLRQGLARAHVAPVVALCVLSDILLIGAGLAGLGHLFTHAPGLAQGLQLTGAAVLAVYGGQALLRAWRGGQGLPHGTPTTATRTLATCLAVTWLNPIVYVDTILVLGNTASQVGPQALLFSTGAMLGSALSLSLIGFGAQGLAPPQTMRCIDTVLGAAMLAVALSLSA